MEFKKTVLILICFVFLLFIGITLPKQGRADDITPTPTWVWQHHNLPSPNKSYTPLPNHLSDADEDYNPDDDLKDALEHGHVSGTPLTKATMKPEPDPPSNLKIEAGDGMARLTWDAMPRAGSYMLYVSEDGKNFKRRLMKPFKKTDITIGVLQNGKTYYFGVECVGPYGRSTKMTVQTVVPGKTKIQSCLFGRETCV